MPLSSLQVVTEERREVCENPVVDRGMQPVTAHIDAHARNLEAARSSADAVGSLENRYG